MTARRTLAEDVPDGTFGGARPLRRRGRPPQPQPDTGGARRFAELAAAVAEVDRAHGYGVHHRYRTTATEQDAA